VKSAWVCCTIDRVVRDGLLAGVHPSLVGVARSIGTPIGFQRQR
jgi:hypothetical protein